MRKIIIPSTIGCEMTYLIESKKTQFTDAEKEFFKVEIIETGIQIYYSGFSTIDAAGYITSNRKERHLEAWELIRVYVRWLRKKHILRDCNVDNDCGAIEISSKICKSYEELREFYTKVDKLCKSIGLFPYIDTEWGGLCHTNIGHSFQTEEIAIRFAKFFHAEVINTPYLSWIFNAAGDHSNANSYIHEDNHDIHCRFLNRSKQKTVNFSQLTYWSEGNKEALYNWNNKECSSNYKDFYLEFRGIEMCKNFNEYNVFLEFILAFWNYVESKAASKERIPRIKYNHIDQFKHDYPTAKHVIKDFKKLLRKLKLPYTPFKFFIERNLEYRYEFYPNALV